MSEYWVSHKKYFCKYCNIYIADDAPSRRQHEGGLRHKGNVERFVRDLYKTGERRKHDLEEEKREMARIERAANAAFAQDVGAGLVKPGSSSQIKPSEEAGPSKPAQKTDLYANYSTAASLGYTDPDEARLKAEQERRNKEGVIGDWEVVAVAEPAATNVEEATEEAKPDLSSVPAESSLKRPAEGHLDSEDTRQFKLRKKKLGAGLGEIYDPGLIPVKLKKEESTSNDGLADQQSTSSATSLSSSSTPKATAVPKWSSRGWSKHDGASTPSITQTTADSDNTGSLEISAAAQPAEASASPTEPNEDGADANVKAEESEAVTKSEALPVKSEEPESSMTAPPSGGLFKKRRIPAGSAGSRERRG
ncbi:hypothetical protein NM688_g2129 [Phlebia brevispora]|uniref:Uncharacterized protein n=1 Tax=Phlebia brevispora TaxID=194682 RepID=A0ACC1TA43_9APHY|nr:hypothetical protein NM688_g2129 [Phlebia brevispora]